MTTVVFENELGLLRYHEVPGRSGIVHHEVRGPIAGEAFRQLLLEGLETLKAKCATKWLSDDRLVTSIDPSDAPWSDTVWWPRMLEAGWKYWAILAPPGSTSGGKTVFQLSSFAMRGALASGLTVRFFTEPEAALAWLRDVDAAP